ncbi:uncharacterized protein LOC116287761 [Actinia tenebrosa]|uniref:Uncharacterized protein LOC116287761 n=1 Tax=Actinia tenebrosa TaxID=6105 RepID=A0A6P8H4E4_ACTTE|nr:uncharacterized protein LOC116287761 [Actinia tenebrosa]
MQKQARLIDEEISYEQTIDDPHLSAQDTQTETTENPNRQDAECQTDLTSDLLCAMEEELNITRQKLSDLQAKTLNENKKRCLHYKIVGNVPELKARKGGEILRKVL